MKQSIVTYRTDKCFYNYQSQPWDEEGYRKMDEDMSKAENYDAATRKYWNRIQDETNYNKTYFNQYKNVQNTNKRFKNYSSVLSTRWCQSCEMYFCFCKKSISHHKIMESVSWSSSLSPPNLYCNEKMPRS